MKAAVYCACGRPLHYDDPEMEKVVEYQSQQLGSPVTRIVLRNGMVILVQRHFFALHGMEAVKELAMKGCDVILPGEVVL